MLVFRERKARGRGCREFRVSPLPHCLPAQLPARPPPHHRRVADYVVLNKIDMLGGGGGAGSDDAAATLGSLSAIVASLNPLAQVRWLWRWLCGDRLARLGAPARCQRAGRRRLLPPPSIRHHRFPPPPLWRARLCVMVCRWCHAARGKCPSSACLVPRPRRWCPGLTLRASTGMVGCGGVGVWGAGVGARARVIDGGDGGRSVRALATVLVVQPFAAVLLCSS